jgi:hypothetical protein
LEHFVSFELLTHVDDIYCHALPHFPLKDELEHPLHLHKDNALNLCNKSCTEILFTVFEKVMGWFYTLIFYYFTPFWICAIPYIYKATETGGHATGAH